MKEVGTIVLVTGAAGFLGQHVVKMLQTRADHVKEIRVLDVVQFVKQLDYKEEKPIHVTVGSITDVELLSKACQGVDCVMHLASIIDISMFQDEKRSYQVNVEGTRNVNDACRKCNVPRLVYCSSNAVVRDTNPLYNVTESNTGTPDAFIFKVYGTTKKLAEDLVMQANSKTLSTISLRPVGLYGEQERLFTPIIARSSLSKNTGYFICPVYTPHTDNCYVGNCAWAFVCADLALQGSRSQSAAGNAYFIRDETPRGCLYEVMTTIAKDAGLKPFCIKLSVWFLRLLCFVLYCFLKPISRFHLININYSEWVFESWETEFHCSYDKAKRFLDYHPIFDFDEAKKLTTSYILKLKNENS